MPTDQPDTLNLPRIERESPEWLADSRAIIAQLHRTSPLAASDEGIEVLTHNSARRVLSQDREFAPASGAVLSAVKEVPEHVELFLRDGLLPAIDRPRHTQIRRVLMSVFTARRVDQQRDLIRQTAQELIDEFIEIGEADFVADFTSRFPLRVVTKIIGVPHEDIPLFQEWTFRIGRLSDHPLGSTYPLVDEALAATAEYLHELIARRRAAPGDDFVTALLRAQETDGVLTEDEMIYNLVNLLMAGQDTTQLQLASALYLLGTHRDQWNDLTANPDLAINAVDESMRFEPSVRRLYRTPRSETEVEGHVFKPGDALVPNTEAANRDPRVFPEPDTFDIRRPNASQQLTFSIGPHFCLGAALSRAEQSEALAMLTQLIPDFAVTDDIDFRSSAHNFGGPERLVITFPAAPRKGVAKQ